MATPLGKGIASVLKKGRALEDGAARRQLVVLRATRRDVLRALTAADPQAFRHFQQHQVLAAIDRELARHRNDALAAAVNDARAALVIGQQQADVILQKTTASLELAGVSSELAAAVVDVTTDQVRAVWSELGTTLKATVRRAALGVTDPYDAMAKVAKAINDPKTFGSAETRAEVILRTEVNRTFSIASDARLRQADARLKGMKKAWLTQVDRRTRESHVAAGESYGPNGTPGPIPVRQPFLVGGAKLMYPLDPGGPPEETINCRCRVLPWVDDVKEALLEAWHELPLCELHAA